MQKITALLALIIALFSPHAKAAVPNECWVGAAQRHNVDVYLLYSIAWVESKLNPQAIGKNRNGSLDLGLMQINTIWLPELAKYQIKPESLIDGCTSVYVGAWILAKNIQRYGYTWQAIGAYNSGTPSIGYRYAQRVYEAHRRVTGISSVTAARTANTSGAVLAKSASSR